MVSILGTSARWELEDINVWVITTSGTVVARLEQGWIVVFTFCFLSAEVSTIHATTILPTVAHHPIPIDKAWAVCSSE